MALSPSPNPPSGTLPDGIRLAIDTIPGLVWTALPDGYIDYLNQRWLDYTGLSTAEAAGWGWQSAVHPDDLPGLERYWRSIIEAGTPGETEARLRRADGVYRWFLFRGVPLYGSDNTLLKWYGQTTDIEDRKTAEHLLRGEKQLLEMIARGHSLRDVLEQLCRFIESATPGCLCSVLLLEHHTSSLVPLGAPSLPADLVHRYDITGTSGPCVVAARENRQVIAADVATDPLWRHCVWRAVALRHGLRACWSTPITNVDGQVLGTFALHFRQPGEPDAGHQTLIAQFTALASIAIERDQKAQALQRSEAHLAEAQRLSATGSFSWQPGVEGALYWSNETFRIYEMDPDAGISLDLARTRIHPDDLTLFNQTVEGAMLRGEDIAFEHRLAFPDGRIKHLQVFARAMHGPDGQPATFVGAVRDNTDRKQREDAFHHLHDALAHVTRVSTLGTLTASIAHEVNQPLAGIVTNASVCARLLDRTPPDIEGALQAAQRTLRDGNRAADVIARLRALFSRKPTASRAFDLNAAIVEVLSLANPEVQRTRTEVCTELDPALPAVEGDRTQIQQVVLNLTLNALEAMNAANVELRRLTVQSHGDPSGQVWVTVHDTGPGLDANAQGNAFEPFFSTKQDGMGMGLAISRSIVESHQGRLWVEGAADGACFRFTLPGCAH